MEEYKKHIERFYSGLPEAFYDGLAYVIPAAYLTIGIELLYGVFNDWVTIYLSRNQPFIVDLFIAFIVLGGLYIVGQLLTTCSYYILHCPLKRIHREENENWYNDYRRIEIEFPAVSLLLTKRYARWMSARNVALSSILLVVLSLFGKQYLCVMIFGLIALLFLFDLVVRYRWLKNYISTIISQAGNKNESNNA